jgi:predicted DNA-binding transcriptional regulator AlpA
MEINMNTLKKGYTFGEAQQYIGNVSRSTLYRLMGEGLPSYTIGSRRYFLVSELDAFIERQVKQESR